MDSPSLCAFLVTQGIRYSDIIEILAKNCHNVYHILTCKLAEKLIFSMS